jgi:dihydroflavonol-4-reductase
MILVTGGTGLVGMHLLYQLTESGDAVRALLRPGSDTSAVERYFLHLDPDIERYYQVEWEPGDVTDIPSLIEQFEGITQVYHAAAVVSFHAKDRERMFKVNVEGTANMVNVALESGVEKFCHISSVAAIGREGKTTVSEKTEWKDNPENSSYSESKYAAEKEVWRGIEEGLNAVIVNPGVILGIGDFSRSSAELFPRLHKGLPYFPGGSNGFVGADDVALICRKLMYSSISAERFILVAEHLTFETLFQRISGSMGLDAPKEKASKWALMTLWWGARFLEILTGKRAFISKESIRNASKDYRYDATKVKKELEVEFEPIASVVQATGSYFVTYELPLRKKS